MSRILLSVLGTNPYLPCCYKLGKDFENLPVRFIQESVIRHYCAGWKGPDDRVVILVTNKDGGNGEPGSYEKNWLDNGHPTREGQPVNGMLGLESILTAIATEKPYHGLAGFINHKIIPWGSNNNELWEIFKIVVEQIHDGDEVIFDVTHSFRSLPMLVFAALLFVRSVRTIKINAITYGAFEVLGSVNTVKEKFPDPCDRKAPVFDLSPLVSIISWSESAMLFNKYGEAGPLLELLYEEINPVLSYSRGKDEAANARRGLAKKIESFISAVKTVRGVEINEMGNLDDAITKVETAGEPNGPGWAFNQLLDSIKMKAQAFKAGSLMNGLHAAKFCIDHSLTQQAITLLNETVISMQCILCGLDWKNKEHREIVSKAPGLDSKAEDTWEGVPGQYPDTTRKVISNIVNDPEYMGLVNSLNIRNDIEHAGMRTDPAGAEKLFNKSKKIYKAAVRWAADKL